MGIRLWRLYLYFLDFAYNSYNVMPDDEVKTHWAVSYSSTAPDNINIKFILHEDNLLTGYPALDTLYVTFYKYQGQLLAFSGLSPVNLTDNLLSGQVYDSLSHEVNVFYNKWDLNNSGDMDVQLLVALQDSGSYFITVIPNNGALPNDIYSLVVKENNQYTVLADSVEIQNIPSEPYIYLTQTTAIQQNSAAPTDYELYNNYPNPFNPSTTISFYIPQSSFISLRIYDVLGNEIASLVDGEKSPGLYNFHFSMTDYQLASGIYFYKIDAKAIHGRKHFSKVGKMVLLK